MLMREENAQEYQYGHSRNGNKMNQSIKQAKHINWNVQQPKQHELERCQTLAIRPVIVMNGNTEIPDDLETAERWLGESRTSSVYWTLYMMSDTGMGTPLHDGETVAEAKVRAKRLLKQFPHMALCESMTNLQARKRLKAVVERSAGKAH